ncbi:hypothetical protein E1263_23725 [Kribbella antibiotica]|uniref:Uncharacterized protein n=1 Tax=Kribbella antibiotica TaxID=190195 RepID=A0A4R4ZKZ6_9ACTN|nr:hypothetical protein [Kribbella antibiotica]TDD57462.1 hypothetical protein E1263_23725 [Kribbella antibiotica]
MRKFALAATAVAALSVGLQTPAFAAAPDAPTDLKISMVDLHVNLTWKDDNAKNVIYVEKEGEAPYLLTTLAETAPNEFSTPAFRIKESDKTRMIVKSEVGGELSEGAVSDWFDTHRPAAPALQDANLAANLTTSLSWTLGPVADSTPNDPLDLPGNGDVFASVDLPGTNAYTQDFDAGTTSGVVPAQARPAAIKLRAMNEWGVGPWGTKIVRLGTLGAGITVPASAVYGARLGIKSTLDLFTSEGREERASGIKVELQARAKAADAWKTYGRYAGNTTTAFDTGMAAQGNRQYRLLVPARKVVSGNVIVLTPATSTSAKSSQTFIKFVSAGFTPSSVKPGANVDFSAKIQPGATISGNLQATDGKSWYNVTSAPFKNGSLLKHGGAGPDKGTYRYRIILPSIVVNGLALSATTSSTFTLTVR